MGAKRDEPVVSLRNIQWFSLDEIAEIWAPRVKLPKSVVLRELRYAVYKLERAGEPQNYELLKTLLPQAPPDDDLPSPDTRINWEFINRFCEKENWVGPDPWSIDLPAGPSFPGRPSVMSAILQELERIAEAGELKATVAEQSRALEMWARQKHPGTQTPKAGAIENGIRSAFKVFKNQFGPRGATVPSNDLLD